MQGHREEKLFFLEKTPSSTMAHTENTWPYNHLSLSVVSLYLNNAIKYTLLPGKPNVIIPKVQLLLENQELT